MSKTECTVRVLRPEEAGVLDNVAPDVFDNDIDPRWTAEFFADPRHHIAVALDGGQVVGFASGVRYVHPDKPPELFINEVGVAPTHQGRGLARRLMHALMDHGRGLGCTQAWVGTEHDNVAANRLYASVGGVREDFVLYAFRLVPEE
ncbi:GNAT family N-acetyltransferase [Longimicrobium sp.]|uniref:GNAT family N-acetyltransferase n=1 Tax=Longimicrobium sp. TaxID=2029185 RepID=UPI002E303837|nr:GNAT family N-acetyltransferase [Longimicrobium sp.]HEX6042177.1 GNAT family N-acetyltransferase [Longimicrobium sp.]